MKAFPLLAFALLPLSVSAQKYVAATESSKSLPVIAVDGTQPLVADSGKLRPAKAKATFELKTSPTYSDAFLQVDAYKVRANPEKPGEVTLTAKLTPDRGLPRVFMSVEVLDEDGKLKELKLFPLDPMSPTQPASYSISVPGSTEKGTKAKPRVRYFADSLELIHSRQSADAQTKARAKRDAYTLSKNPSRPLAPAYQVSPEYPAAFATSRKAGQAVVVCVTDASGMVTDARVKSASEPEFGEAAVAAVRQWVFTPEIKNGQFVGSTVGIPFNFTPPAKPAEKPAPPLGE